MKISMPAKSPRANMKSKLSNFDVVLEAPPQSKNSFDKKDLA
jgi:hypothetical protein